MKVIIIVLLSLYSLVGLSQSNKLTIQQAVDVALKNNGSIKSAYYEVESQRQLKKTAFDLPKTNVSLLYGQYNSYAKNDNNITVTQTIPFVALGSQSALNRSLVASMELKKTATENELTYQVKQVYYQLAFTQARHSLLMQQDSIFEGFFKAASLRYKTGESKFLEQTTAETQRNEVRNLILQNEGTITVLRTQLKTLLGSEVLPDIVDNPMIELIVESIPDTTQITTNPSLTYIRQQVEVAASFKKVEVAKFAPDLLLGYFNQTLAGVVSDNGTVASNTTRFSGFQVGLAVPLWFLPHQGRVKAAEFSKQAAQSNYQYYHATLQGQFQQAVQQFLKNKSSLAYYTSSALPNANLILKHSQVAFQSGEIGYAEYLLGVRNAVSIKEGHLQTLNDYNQSIIYIEFLSGIK